MERSIGISANLGVKGISANLGVKGISGNFLGIHRSSEKHKGVVMGDTIEKYRSNRYFCNYIRYRLLSITKKSIVKMIAITLRMRINNTRGSDVGALSTFYI